MTQINDEFMESFKHLDKICKEIFDTEKGITAYIDSMESISNGSRYVSNWNSTLKRLKELRHIRNTYAHEIGTSYEDICSSYDIEWLDDFYRSIMNTTDPLALYRQATAPKPHVTKIEQPNRNDFHTFNSYDNEKHLSGLSIFLILVITVAIVLGLVWFLV